MTPQFHAINGQTNYLCNATTLKTITDSTEGLIHCSSKIKTRDSDDCRLSQPQQQIMFDIKFTNFAAWA
tara:strand:- start:1708 stop:1914 length:207 start_codon:yes stop_codon:yes gene_type:complete